MSVSHWVTITDFIAAKFNMQLPGAGHAAYGINPWYAAWIGAHLSSAAFIVGSLLTADTPKDKKQILGREAHGVS